MMDSNFFGPLSSVKQTAVCPGPHPLSETHEHALLTAPSCPPGAEGRSQQTRETCGAGGVLMLSAHFPKAASNAPSSWPHFPPVII